MNLELIFIIFLIGIFEFYNGANDRANSVATIIATGVIRPKIAYLLSAICNFIPVFFTTAVAKTIYKGILVSPLDSQYLYYVLISTIIFIAVSTTFGIPISCSQSLLASLVGTGIACFGIQGLYLQKICIKLIIPLITMPILCFSVSKFFYYLIKKLNNKTKKIFGKLQIFSSMLMSVSHGHNDAQTGIGLSMLALISFGILTNTSEIPIWVILFSHFMIAIGTFTVGYNVTKTLGTINNLKPIDGFVSETTGGIIIELCSIIGIPTSTTHAITSAIAGVGDIKNLDCNLIKKIIIGWVATPVICIFLAYLLTILAKNIL